jgi:hypothetical protein
MTVFEAVVFFKAIPSIKDKLAMLQDVGARLYKDRAISYNYIWWRGAKN